MDLNLYFILDYMGCLCMYEYVACLTCMLDDFLSVYVFLHVLYTLIQYSICWVMWDVSISVCTVL